MKTAEPPGDTRWRYLIALGSNIRHHRHGTPRGVLQAALIELARHDMVVARAAPIRSSLPIGPSARRYANSAALIDSDLPPRALLGRLQRIERDFGRRRGRRWAARVLDLDIILWSGGALRPGRRCRGALTLPHPAFRERRFVLAPAAWLAPYWRDPHTGLTLRQLHARLTRRTRLPRAPAR